MNVKEWVRAELDRTADEILNDPAMRDTVNDLTERMDCTRMVAAKIIALKGGEPWTLRN